MPRNTCIQVLPRADRVETKNVSVLKPSVRQRGRKDGNLHLKCRRGVILVSASTEDARVYLVVSRFKLPTLELKSLIICKGRSVILRALLEREFWCQD